MFVSNPDPFLLPSFRISPFQTSDMAFNNQLPEDDFATDYFNKRFGAKQWQYTNNGREAIAKALENYKLYKTDLVTIVTTSENLYISSCVTKTIEAFCRWNREITAETKIIFVNHEFGYPYENMQALIATGLPIVEDCCTTFFSQDENQSIGKYGDYAVYSFPKFFPLQIGGLLVSNKRPLENEVINATTQTYIQNTLSHHLRNEVEILNKRRSNFDYALSQLSKLGFTSRFEISEKIVPSALMLNNNGVVKDLQELKFFLGRHGIQSSVFYGEDAFFIPTHQNLKPSDYDYFTHCIASFVQSQS